VIRRKPKHRKAPWTLTAPKPKPKRRDNYAAEAHEFVSWWANVRGLLCVVVLKIPELRDGRLYGHPISAKLNEVHHIFGRKRELKMWKPGWMPVSKQGQRWIHAHVEAARARGWYAPRGYWDDPRRVLRDFGGCKNWTEVRARILLMNQ
jgi:hypothetical protein